MTAGDDPGRREDANERPGDEPGAGGPEFDPDSEGSALDPDDVERLFSVLDVAVSALDADLRERTLSVIEAAIASGSGAGDQTVADLVAMLEDLLVEPDEVDEDELDEVLLAVEELLDDAWAGDEFAGTLAERFRATTGLGEVIAAAGETTGFGDRSPTRGAAATESATSGDDLVRIARIAGAATRGATSTSARTGARTGLRMALAAANEGTPAAMVARTRAVALDELDRAGFDVGEENDSWLDRREERTDGRRADERNLRERGERLLSESAEVGAASPDHPAFASMLDQLRPDEARILRLLATEGPQPRIEVRDRGLVPAGSRPVAEWLTMIGCDAGCRNPEKTPVALQNLERLGLVTESGDTVDDLQQYRILEAQSHVEAAHERARWSKSVFGSVRLTDLGVAFCEAGFPFEVTADRPTLEFREDDA